MKKNDEDERAFIKLSSEFVFLFNNKVVYSDAKVVPFSEMLLLYSETPPKIFTNVLYSPTSQVVPQEDYTKAIFTEICYEHQISCK